MQNQYNLYAKKGKEGLEYSNKHFLKEWINSLPEGEDIVIKFNVAKSYKSARQLRLLYSMFRSLSDKLGYNVEEVKMLLKLQFGLCFTNVIEGVELSICKSISEMTRTEISDFIEKIDRWSTVTFNYPLLTSDDIQFLKTTN